MLAASSSIPTAPLHDPPFAQSGHYRSVVPPPGQSSPVIWPPAEAALSLCVNILWKWHRGPPARRKWGPEGADGSPGGGGGGGCWGLAATLRLKRWSFRSSAADLVYFHLPLEGVGQAIQPRPYRSALESPGNVRRCKANRETVLRGEPPPQGLGYSHMRDAAQTCSQHRNLLSRM